MLKAILEKEVMTRRKRHAASADFAQVSGLSEPQISLKVPKIDMLPSKQWVVSSIPSRDVLASILTLESKRATATGRNLMKERICYENKSCLYQIISFCIASNTYIKGEQMR